MTIKGTAMGLCVGLSSAVLADESCFEWQSRDEFGTYTLSPWMADPNAACAAANGWKGIVTLTGGRQYSPNLCVARVHHMETPPSSDWQGTYMLTRRAIAGCIRIRDRYHDKFPNCEPRLGRPILPLTGTKVLRESLGSWTLAGRSASLDYSTRSKLPSNDPSKMLNVDGAITPSFGPLWFSSLHKRLSLRFDASGTAQSMLASRGAGGWTTFVRQSNGSYLADSDVADQVIQVSSGSTATWRYIDATSQSQEVYDGMGRLQSVTYSNGSSLVYTYSNNLTPLSEAPAPELITRIEDQRGRKVQFRYTSSDGTFDNARVSQLVDPNGLVTNFSYDTSGSLIQISWPDGANRQFLRERGDIPWAVTGVVDENSTRVATYSYDAAGRAVETQGAGGIEHYAASYASAPSWNIVETFDSATNVLWREHYWIAPQGVSVVDPSGSTLALAAALVNGTPLSAGQSQPAGSGCASSASAVTYDAAGNVASKDDFNGKRTCSVYDQGRKLEIARVEGMPNSRSCASVAEALPPSGSRRVSMEWHPYWSLRTRLAEPGRLTTSVYNGQPDPFNGNTIASCAPSTAQLPDGKPIAVLCKKVEQASTDADGGIGFGNPGALADPHYASVTLLLRMDGLSGSTTFTDLSSAQNTPIVTSPVVTDTANAKFGTAAGNFTGGYIQYADSPNWDLGSDDFTVEMWVKFNSASAGQRVYFFGKANSGASVYSLMLGKLADNKLVVYWNGSSVDGGVQDTAPVVPNTWYHVAIVRSGGIVTMWKNGVSVGSGAIGGSLVANTNRLGIGVLGEYTYAYGGTYGTRMMGWLDDVRITKGVARYTSAFTPPSVPIDASVPLRAESWTYNQYGQVVTHDGPRTDVSDVTTYAYYSDTAFTGTDPNAVGHTMGDLQSVTDAAGQVTQHTQYDKHGNVLQSVDPNGVTTNYTYDLRQRLLSVSVGGQTTSYTYDAVGQLTRVTQPDATWVGWEYDDAHRQKAALDNLGNRIDYTLDNAGNRTGESVKDPSGTLKRSLARSIDALGRVQQTTGRQ